MLQHKEPIKTKKCQFTYPPRETEHSTEQSRNSAKLRRIPNEKRQLAPNGLPYSAQNGAAMCKGSSAQNQQETQKDNPINLIVYIPSDLMFQYQ